MSLALATGNTITGVAGSATAITYTISGDEIAAGADAFKVLAQGQLPSSVGTLYTVPASTEAIVKTIHLANMTGGTVTARLNVKGTAAANAILPPISILAGGFAIYADDGWRVYNDQGQLLSVGATGATGPTGPGDIATDTIWDAKGDLAAGTGADTAARLPTVADGASLRTKVAASTGLEWQVNSLDNAVAPAVIDDSNDGYSVGSRWIDTTADKEYVCLDATVGAAVWTETTGGGVTVEDEGTPLATVADTLDFVGAGVVASGTGTTKTITISGAADILDLPTAEMDDALVLAPDGAGGVEFRAETGGGGGDSPADVAASLITAYSLFR